MASSPDSHDGDPGFQIAPMGDVVFVMMLFFMACAGSVVNERELSANLPSPGRHPDASVGVIVVEIAEDGSVVVNNQPFAVPADQQLTALRQWLRGVREEFGDRDTVLIRPAPTIRHERLMDVLNALTAAGVKKLTFS